MNTDNETPLRLIRGCGTRKKGGLYLETGLSTQGTPITNFLCDPPLPLPDTRDVTAIGSQLVSRNEVWHVLDWVGQSHYLNVADYVEELKRFGLSRRIAETIDFSKLTPASRIMLVHAKAQVDNFLEYQQWQCPKGYEHHKPEFSCSEDLREKPMCAGIWWEDIAGGNSVAETQESETADSRRVVRQMPSFNYYGRRTPAGVIPQYRPAVFGTFPISRIVLVKGGDRHAEKLAIAGCSQLPVAEVTV